MLAAIFAVTVRYRRLILTVALVLAGGLVVGRWLSPALDLILLVAAVLTGVLVLSLVLLAGRPRPAAFLVKPEARAFAIEPGAVQTYMTVGITFVVSSQLLNAGQLAGVGLFTVPLLLVALGIQLAAGWRGSSIELRPDGVYHRDFVGSLTVPWEALAPGGPSRPAVRASTLALAYAQPDLVRRRGILPLGWRLLHIDNVDPWFIADAIRYYVDHPQHRAAIGEPAEYQRLWHALTSAPTGPGHGHAS